MGRKPKGKVLTLRPIRLDDDVWAECQRLGKEHGTINEGLRERLFYITDQELQETRVHQAALAHAVRFKPPLLKPSEKKK
jgi:hypothetical protein